MRWIVCIACLYAAISVIHACASIEEGELHVGELAGSVAYLGIGACYVASHWSHWKGGKAKH